MHTQLNETEKKECTALMEIKEKAIANTQVIKDKIELIKDSIAA